MEPAAILDQLTFSDDLPRDALRAAAERRSDMVPLFLEQIEAFAGDGSAAEAERNPLLFIFHLLGDWRETSAYRALARLLSCPGEDVDAVLGWSITETSHRVMAAVFDGDPQPIYNIILNEDADEFIRSRMCDTLFMLVSQGRLDQSEVASFLRDCWINLRPQEPCFVWVGWQSAITLLGLTELKDLVKQAFDRGFIDASWLSYRDFETDLQHALRNPTEPWQEWNGEFTPFGDTIEELSGWYCFSERRKLDLERARNAPPLPLFPPPGPTINPMRGVGRNDPCPCGSGKKYKKCCLQ
jgi:Protein of unknown function (DUF1186)/SEC-C motif